MKLLFLDIDGVLNTHVMSHVSGSCTLDEDKVHRLNTILKKTGADLIISSAWRWLVHNRNMTLIGFDWLLRSHGVMANRLRGVTRMEDHLNPNDDRGYLISEYLKPLKVKSYCVIDDLDLSITACGHPFVQTISDVGLTDTDMEKAIEILGV